VQTILVYTNPDPHQQPKFWCFSER